MRLKRVTTMSFKLPWNKSEAVRQEAVFNLKNKECQKLFKEETSNNNKLSKVFDEEEDIDKAT